MNSVEEWKEKRLKRMDAALTKIDEVIEDTKLLDGIPELILQAAQIEDKGRRKDAAVTLAYMWVYLKGKLNKIDALVNEGMTFPEDKNE